MAHSNYRFPSVNSGSWTNGGNAYASDNVYASSTTNGATHTYSSFTRDSLSLINSIPNPSTAVTINGITVEIECYMNTSSPLNGDSATLGVEISIDGGSNWSASKTNAIVFIDGETYVTFGGVADAWGLTLVRNSFSDANFQLRITSTALSVTETLFVDHIRLKVSYSGANTDWTADAQCRGAWTMDEGATALRDKSSNDYDLTPSGTPGTYNVTGQYGGSFDFTQANNAFFTNTNVGAETIHSGCAWIAPDDDGDINTLMSNSAGCIMARNNGADGWYFSLQASNDLKFMHSWTSAGNSRWFTAGDLVPYDGTYTHVAFSYNGSSTSNDALIFIDGVSQSVTEASAPAGTIENAGQLRVGTSEGTVHEFDGNIDELIYLAQTLTASEVAGIMDNGIEGVWGAAGAAKALWPWRTGFWGGVNPSMA